MTSTAPVDDTTIELDSITDILDRQEKQRERAEARAPKGFDPACLFLLELGFENLFDPTGNEQVWRCRGCGSDVKRWERNKHQEQHRRAVARGDHKAKEARMGKGATETARQQREARAQSLSQGRTAVATAEATVEQGAAVEEAEKPKGSVGWRPSNTEASQQILDTLVKRLGKALPKGAVLEAKANEKVGYTSIKVNDKLIGYGWLTGKPQLRVEVAIEVNESPASTGPVVLVCKRSQSMRARTVITSEPSEYDFAVAMLMVAARKWSGVK